MRLSLSAVRGNTHYLRQGIALVEALSRGDYVATARAGWAPVGSQFRHVLDHYLAFLDGWAAGRIDYDARGRNRETETDPARALRVAGWIVEELERIHTEDGDRTVLVQMDSGGNDGVPDWRPSTVGRELQFLVSHTVHHYALMKLLLEDRGVATDAELGTAPSTAAYQRSTGIRESGNPPARAVVRSASPQASR
jgi:uncharacterized damage-inducible protein DinB